DILRLRREHESFMRHELKNLLGPIKGFSDLLLMGGLEGLGEKQASFITRISQATGAAVELIDNLKKLQDIESGSFDLETVPVDVAQVIAGRIDELGLAAREQGVVIRLLNNAERTIVQGDPTLLPGVFLNVLKNAVEHVSGLEDRSQKTVEVVVDNKEDSVVIRVNNRGEPIPEGKLRTFFDKFNSDRRKKKEGMGLGTTYAWLVTRAHDGCIKVASNSMEGTTVTISLPVIM
ncbi:MAG: GHKL domain-containing protein, partial [Candidatus Latescibacteria bacterium]|nr:GHKL domain-containing protein [Candidatus Latescibacterota bacterium]